MNFRKLLQTAKLLVLLAALLLVALGSMGSLVLFGYALSRIG